MRSIVSALAALLLVTTPALAQNSTTNPFPDPIEAEEGAVVVGVEEFASLPDVDGEPARIMTMVPEPGTDRLFVSEMRGQIYRVSADGQSVTAYLDVDADRWGVGVESSGRERGVQSFAVHPQFGEADTPGHGRIYVWTDTRNTDPEADFATPRDETAQHTVLLEFTAENPRAASYDGGPPRELMRFEQPFGNHNGGDLAFDPTARPGEADFGLLYVGVGDGGAGGDPMNQGQDLTSAFGKILRIDPLAEGATRGEADGTTGQYGIPPENPFAGDDGGALAEIYALGLRNPQHLEWDPATGEMFVADIGQNIVEEVSPVSPGANLGWNVWEGSFRFLGSDGVRADGRRADPEMTFPVAEYDHTDPLLSGRAAVTGLEVYRGDRIPALRDLLIFGDMPRGEIFYVRADDLPDGGQDPVRRILLDDGSGAHTLLELVREKNREQGREPASRVDLRLGPGHDGRLFLLNKHDGWIRELTPRGG